jgi:hypothetical protein
MIATGSDRVYSKGLRANMLVRCFCWQLPKFSFLFTEASQGFSVFAEKNISQKCWTLANEWPKSHFSLDISRRRFLKQISVKYWSISILKTLYWYLQYSKVQRLTHPNIQNFTPLFHLGTIFTFLEKIEKNLTYHASGPARCFYALKAYGAIPYFAKIKHFWNLLFPSISLHQTASFR